MLSLGISDKREFAILGLNIQMFFYFVSDNLKSFRDVWLVGDDFLKNLWPTIVATKCRTTADGPAMPYLFEFFYMVKLYPSGATIPRSKIACLHN